MRMRRKPNLGPRMDRCDRVWVREPAALRGNWKSLMPQAREVRLEVGCGKGKFTVETAAAEPDVLLIAMERVPEALVMAMEKAVALELKNVFFISEDVERVQELFTPGEIDRIYINFCDPWPHKKHAPRRLTHRGFLAKYRSVLRPDGRIDFKTDNQGLFDFSVEEFAADRWDLDELTRDLHSAGPVGIMTGYEEKFYALGTPICRCVARPRRDDSA